MKNFEYYTPTKVVFGKGTESQVGKLIREQGAKKVLIHYGSGSVVRSGLLQKVEAVLKEEGIAYVKLGVLCPILVCLKYMRALSLQKRKMWILFWL